MKRTRTIGAALLATLLLATGAFYLGRRTGPSMEASMAAPAAADTRQVLYWHDPMVPGQRFDKPGKSPFMDMQLVPVYAEGATQNTGVAISPAVQQNLGIRYAKVRRAETSTSFDAVGTVQFDERLNVAVQTRVAGYVEQLSVRAPMERVRKGQALATVFAPDWLGPQNELLALQRAGVSAEIVGAARERLRALSIPADLVRRSEATGTAQARYVLTAPSAGVVAELGVREGVAVSPGTTLFRIAGLDKVWAVAQIPEAQALRLARGQKVQAVLQADPTQTFSGTLDEILPEIDAATRTLKARFEVDNRNGKLVPGLLLRLQVAGPRSTRLLVPSEAVIRTGQRVVVIVRQPEGGFEPREVSLGADQGEDTEVLSGLAEGDQVVASGQFLIDSEARLRSVLGNIAAPAPVSAASAPAAAIHQAEGKVETVAPDSITVSHGPVATLRWPPMTMGFAKASPEAFPDIRPGDTVRFEFKEGGPTGYELVGVQRVTAGGKP
ncbi:MULTISPECIES: efflux RND transporter periplasmic adaptor subunit [unclassified Variovorax]|uniref:efflux RND transporter periplasmic adaptor subunit n=1 Tax=unclassified Variovorax TaxID=663243 RepID=UPI0025775AC6|nr:MULTISPECIES: efflux RND transporter periplasmic adaptor subunit [unclassified Variovorax]MDM0086941.1 efflux RND transporter periplasmic adaptor subunit [Variovorax sp. J22G40]MDM0144802.1 efflux RND transporter periplasmic adaptor subunit [Variovorax sp. J2P1-31]